MKKPLFCSTWIETRIRERKKNDGQSSDSIISFYQNPHLKTNENMEVITVYSLGDVSAENIAVTLHELLYVVTSPE